MLIVALVLWRGRIQLGDPEEETHKPRNPNKAIICFILIMTISPSSSH